MLHSDSDRMDESDPDRDASCWGMDHRACAEKETGLKFERRFFGSSSCGNQNDQRTQTRAIMFSLACGSGSYVCIALPQLETAPSSPKVFDWCDVSRLAESFVRFACCCRLLSVCLRVPSQWWRDERTRVRACFDRSLVSACRFDSTDSPTLAGLGSLQIHPAPTHSRTQTSAALPTTSTCSRCRCQRGWQWQCG